MSSPSTTSQDPGERIPLTSHNRRGPYRSHTRTPRQTLHNRKRRKLNKTVQSPTYGGGSEAGTLETHSDKENTCKNATDLCLADEPISDDTPNSSISEAEEADDTQSLAQTESDPTSPRLFPGSLLSSSTSHLLIRSYMCRHHLSNQGQEDLQLLQLNLPRDSARLPTSLYMFRKSSGSADSISIASTAHFYCPRCYTALSDSASTICPNLLCGTSLSAQSTPNFITVSVTEQLKVLLERKFRNQTCIWSSEPAHFRTRGKFSGECIY